MKLIYIFWIGLSVGTVFGDLDEDTRNILRAMKNDQEIETSYKRHFNWTKMYRPLPSIPIYKPLDIDIKKILPRPKTLSIPTSTRFRFTKYKRKSTKLIAKIIGGVCGIIIIGLLSICKMIKSKTDETSTEESTLESPGFRPEVIPLPYAPLSGPNHQQSNLNLPQPDACSQQPDACSQQDPNPQPANRVPLSLTCIKIIPKDKLDAPRVILIPATMSRSPTSTIRSFTIISKSPQNNLKE